MMTEAEAGIAPVGKNVSLMSAVFGNLKPILNNLFRVLYIVVRPIMLQLIVLRKLFIDWETPVQTIMASMVYLYVWYYGYMISWVLLMTWWGLTKRLWTYKFFGGTYVPYDEGLSEKEMLKGFKATKIELKYGKDDPIAEDVQKVAKITGAIGRLGLKVQYNFNWQGNTVKTSVVWVIILVMSLCHSFVPWRFIFYWLVRVALFAGWFVATVLVPVLRIFPTATTKIKRFLFNRGFLSHIKPKYTTADGSDTYAELSREHVQLLQSFGVNETVRADRVLEERGGWHDMFFYPTTAVLRTGHTTHVKAFIRPINMLLARFATLNPGFDMRAYCHRHLEAITTMEGGKVFVFDVNTVRTELNDHPNLAMCFFRWLGYQLTKRTERSITLKGIEDTADEELLEGFNPDRDDSSTNPDAMLARRAAEKRKQMLFALRDKFRVSPDEAVLHIAGDVYRKRKGKKFYGNVFVTIAHLAFLPGTISQQGERWIADATDVTTAFVNKAGALEIRFVQDEVRHLYHEDRSVLMEVVSSINHMKTASLKTEGVDLDNLDTAELGQLRKHDIRASVQKSISRSRGSSRTLNSRLSVLKTQVTGFPETAADKVNRSTSSPIFSNRAVRHSSPGHIPSGGKDGLPEKDESEKASTTAVDVDEDEDAKLLEEELAESEATLAPGAPSQWTHIRITNVMPKPMYEKILDRRMRKQFAAGSVILQQDVTREVAVQVLWKGKAKAVLRKSVGNELFLGYINEGSIFGETAYLLEANAGASVVADTDCVVYNLPGPWLDGLFDMDRLLGANFFETVCLVLLERAVLTEEALSSKKKKSDTND